MLLLNVGDAAVVYDNTSDHGFKTGDIVIVVEKYSSNPLDERYYAVPEDEPFRGHDAYNNGWFVADSDVFKYLQEPTHIE